jgi:hypothetical protein
MSKHNLDSSDPLVRWLAEEAVMADLFKSAVLGIGRETQRPTELVSIRTLLAYVRRDHDAPADITIERAICTDPTTARRYINFLAGIAQASSPVAIAAASKVVPERTIGKWHLRVSAPAGQLPVLVLTQREPASAPAAIEAVGTGHEGGMVRLPLPKPVNHAIQLPLNDDVAELAAFHRLIADTSTQIFLLPSLTSAT